MDMSCRAKSDEPDLMQTLSADPQSKGQQYVDKDAERLAQLGHSQDLDRRFSVWSAASLCMCLLATWEAVSSVISAALIAGGAPCLFYN